MVGAADTTRPYEICRYDRSRVVRRALRFDLLLEIRVAASDADFAAAWLRWEKF